MSLKRQTFFALTWAFADSFFLKGLTFITSILLARILGAAEFGIIGMITIFIAIGTTLVDSGLSSSLIRVTDADFRDYSTIYYVNIFMSILIYTTFYFCAPLIAKFYAQDILTKVIRVYCLTFVISAFSAVHLTLLSKNMQFRRIMLLNIPGTIIGAILGIIMGYKGYGVWSIVWMNLSAQIIFTFLLWFFSDWKPSWFFSFEKMNLHIGFGYKLLISTLLNTFITNAYNVVIGKFFNVQSLGYFERARTYNEYPVTIITSIISKVTYPLLSKIQEEKALIATTYKQMLQLSFFVTAPLMFSLAAVADPLIELILGTSWLPSVLYFKIICLASMFYPVHAFNINILKVYGRSDLFLKIEVIKIILLSILMIIALPFGVLGLTWSIVFSSFIALVINMFYSSKMISYTTSRQLRDMLPTFLTGAITFIIMRALLSTLITQSLYLQISGTLIIGIVFYVLINLLLRSKPLQLIFMLIRNRNI